MILALILGLIVGTVGYVGCQIGYGDLIPPSGIGWVQLAGFIIVIPSMIILKAKGK